MKVRFRTSFTADLRKLKDEHVLARVEELIAGMESADSLSQVPNVKKLRGSGNYFRVRLGDYRVGFALEGDTVTLVRILHRREVYRYFP